MTGIPVIFQMEEKSASSSVVLRRGNISMGRLCKGNGNVDGNVTPKYNLVLSQVFRDDFILFTFYIACSRLPDSREREKNACEK